jgi:hypothetical protein
MTHMKNRKLVFKPKKELKSRTISINNNQTYYTVMNYTISGTVAHTFHQDLHFTPLHHT